MLLIQTVSRSNLPLTRTDLLPQSALKQLLTRFIGKLSYFKVISGKFNSSTPAFNANTGKEERMGKIVKLFGAKQIDAGELTAGDIRAVTQTFRIFNRRYSLLSFKRS